MGSVNDMKALRPILELLADERGAESVEFGLVAVVVACASVHWRRKVQAAIDDQVIEALAEVEAEA